MTKANKRETTLCFHTLAGKKLLYTINLNFLFAIAYVYVKHD